MSDTGRRPSRRKSGSSSPQDASQYSRYNRGDTRQTEYSRYSRQSMGPQANQTDYRPVASTAGVDGRYSRDSVLASHRAQQRKSRRKKVLIGILIAIVVVAVVGAGAAFAYFKGISDNLHEGVTDETLEALGDTKYTGDAFYMLLLGTDGAWWRDEDPEFDGVYRTDSMILARVDPKTLTVSMVSLQRDTLVDMGTYGEQKLNAAYTLGGAAYTIEVVEELAGVDISHYAEIDFDGFCAVVDAIGGIDVDVPMEIDDDEAGGHLDAGLQHLDGDGALILCRSRHTYDDYGKGDEYRAANQRMVLSAIAKKVLTSDLPTMISAVNSISQCVATDFSVTDILSIANTLRDMDTDNDIYTAQMPTTSAYYNNVWYEILDKPSWTTMMKRMDEGLPPAEESVVDDSTGVILSSSGDGVSATGDETSSTSDGSSGKIAVRNGGGVEGAGAKAAKKFEAMGYTCDVSNAESMTYTYSMVIYSKSSQADEAAKLSAALGTGKTVLNDGTYSIPSDCDFMVVVGSDYAV